VTGAEDPPADVGGAVTLGVPVALGDTVEPFGLTWLPVLLVLLELYSCWTTRPSTKSAAEMIRAIRMTVVITTPVMRASSFQVGQTTLRNSSTTLAK
jgi:hypothetical protein